jgi:histidinol-phosphate aminotransferase
MSHFPREDYRKLDLYEPGRTPVTVDMSDNTNLWGVHPRALEVVRKAPPDALNRYPSVYADALKQAVARKLNLFMDCITTGCGSDDLLDSTFRAACVPPARLAYPSPTFSMVEAFGRMNGLEPRPVPWELAAEDPARLLEEDPAIIYLCRPNNPTGAHLDREWVLALLQAGGPGGPVVVLDEAYADFAPDNLLKEAVESHRMLVLRTLSKLYGLAGLRVAFAVGAPGLIAEVEKSRGPYKVSQVAERAAIAALRDASGWAEKIVQETVENRARLADELRKRGLRPLPSEANFLLVPVSPASATRLNDALKDRGVAIRPYPDLPDLGDCIRITIGPWEMIEWFLVALDDLISPQSGRDD